MQIQKYGHLFSEFSAVREEQGRTTYINYADVKEEAQKRNQTAAISFETGKNSFTALVEREKETLVFFSIPYDKGWTATVNGKPVQIEKVNVGFMAVLVEEGISEIVFSYKTPGLSQGVTVSLAALLVFVIYITVVFIYRKRHPAAIYPECEAFLNAWQQPQDESLPPEFEIAEEPCNEE